jgi:elongation factor G
LFSAVDGVEPQSETNWRFEINIRYHVLDSLIKWIVKVLTFDGLSTSRDMLKSNAVAITLPIGEENDFKGVVDLVRKQEAIVWDDEGLGNFDVVAIPEEMLDEVKEYRSILIEAVADYDENLLKIHGR